MCLWISRSFVNASPNELELIIKHEQWFLSWLNIIQILNYLFLWPFLSSFFQLMELIFTSPINNSLVLKVRYSLLSLWWLCLSYAIQSMFQLIYSILYLLFIIYLIFIKIRSWYLSETISVLDWFWCNCLFLMFR